MPDTHLSARTVITAAAALAHVNNAPPAHALTDGNLRYLGDPVLREIPPELKDLTDAERDLIEVMKSVVIRNGAAGLAANQIGAVRRIIVCRIGGRNGELIAFVNPKIIRASEEKHTGFDGCLSIPGFSTTTERSHTIIVNYQTPTDMTECEATFGGMDARVIQHEVDHLNGILIVDLVSRQQRRQAQRLVETFLAQGCRL